MNQREEEAKRELYEALWKSDSVLGRELTRQICDEALKPRPTMKQIFGDSFFPKPQV